MTRVMDRLRESALVEQLVRLGHRFAPIAAIALLVICMGGKWHFATAAPQSIADETAAKSRARARASKAKAGGSGTATAPANTSGTATAASTTGSATAAAGTSVSTSELGGEVERPAKKSARELTGKLNINTATEEQLMLLPTVGPAKAERIVTWRKKNGGFRRAMDIRRVKGFGYKTFKRLEPFLDIKGDNTLR